MKLIPLVKLSLIIILPITMILVTGLLLVTQPTSAANRKLLPPTSPCDQTGNLPPLTAVPDQNYSRAIPLLEYQGVSTIELLSAYAGTPGANDNTFGTFKILEEDDTFYLWIGSLIRRNGDNSAPSSVGQRFDSQNGLVWCNRTDTNLSITDPYKFVLGLRNILKSGNIYEGWDEYYYELSAGWGQSVRYVTSTNGIDWTVVNQPALIGAHSASVIKEGNTYQMWQHPGVDPIFYSGSLALRQRTSSAGGSGWGNWQTDGTVVTVDGNNEIIGVSRVRRLTNGVYQLFYSDGDYINLATSTNGISFTTQISKLINLTHTLPITSIYTHLGKDVAFD